MRKVQVLYVSCLHDPYTDSIRHTNPPRFTIRGITAFPPQAMRQRMHEECEWSDQRGWNENSAF